jgi:glycosyltransferase involved in cell wall biosynthesis
MACGTPVICSDQPCLPEIAGDAALLCPPADIDRLAAALAQVVNAADLRQTLIQRGFARAREFPWARGIGALLSVYRQ